MAEPRSVWVDFNDIRTRPDGIDEVVSIYVDDAYIDPSSVTLRERVVIDDQDGLRCNGIISGLGQRRDDGLAFVWVEIVPDTWEHYGGY